MPKQKRTTKKTKPTTRRKTTKTTELARAVSAEPLVDFFTKVVKGTKKLLSSVR